MKMNTHTLKFTRSIYSRYPHQPFGLMANEESLEASPLNHRLVGNKKFVGTNILLLVLGQECPPHLHKGL